MGQLVFACSVKFYPNLVDPDWPNPQDGRLVSIRTSPINAIMAMDAWLKDYGQLMELATQPHAGPVYVGVSGVVQWTVSIWDVTSMGEERTKQIGAVTSCGKPDIYHVQTLGDMADQYLDRIGKL